MRVARTVALTALLLWSLRAAPIRAERGRNPYEPGRTYAAWLLTGQTAPLWERFSPAVRSAVGSEAALAALLQQTRNSTGVETGVLAERVFPFFPVTVYGRRSSFASQTAPWVLEFTYDASGEILGVTLQPERIAPSPFAGYATRTRLRLPVTGEWQITAGGDSLLENHHVIAVDQRFAYDLVGVDENGVFAGDGSRNEDYPGFGQPILAPADGVIVEAVDGVPDNIPGQVIPGHLAGNRIVLDHGNGEYSMLAHFRQGTLRVRAGERVVEGQELGQCGNSGNSSGPHLHYHLQNTPIWGGGEGLPAQFRNYVQDGTPVDRGEPVRGQIVAPQDSSGVADPLPKRRPAREHTSPPTVSRP